jgi:phage tail-like protein
VRTTVDGLASPHPIGMLLPGLYHDNDLAQRFTGALDVVLAPVLATLDSGEAYVDPLLAPLDFVEWLAEWVGVELDASWPEPRQRALVSRAAELYAWRGTVRGVTEAVAIYTGVVPEVAETGGTAWMGTPPPTGELPGDPRGLLLVRVRVAPGEPIDRARLDRLVAAAKPAHIAHHVEIIEDPGLAPALPRPSPALGAAPVPDDVPEDLDADLADQGDQGDQGEVAELDELDDRLQDDWRADETAAEEQAPPVTPARGIAPTVVPLHTDDEPDPAEGHDPGDGPDWAGNDTEGGGEGGTSPRGNDPAGDDRDGEG